jgi:hypothetical protein
MFPLFRSFVPLHNPIGFGASDFIEFGLALLLVVAMLVWRPWLEPLAGRLAQRTAWCMLMLAVLPVALRLALLAHHPPPSPDLYDEFGHLLVADTLRHFRLANPPHPMHHFFETFFVLQEPAYSSIYPIGQGLMLAIGWTIFGLPWAGVLLSTAAFCALCYWMLRGWTSPGWALAGGLLAVIEFGPLNQWMNSYWGGAFTAAAGCLVFGALPRLVEHHRARDAVLLGVGIAINLLTRPYESIFLILSVLLFFLPALRKPLEWRMAARVLAIAGLAVVPAVAITLAHNRAVTGSWTTMPYALSQYQYGVPAALTFQANPVPHRPLTREQELDYKMQAGFRGSAPETLSSYLQRMEYRVRYYRFFFLAPLYLVLPAFFFAVREYRCLWVAASALLFALGINFFPAFQFHYLAAVTCLFVLIGITGLRQLSRLQVAGWLAGAEAAWLIGILCAAHFLFWYGTHIFENDASLALRRFETWDSINHGNPERRIAIGRQLAQTPGRQLVFVRYWPQHIFQDEWVYNRASIDTAPVVWARDLGPEEDLKLTRYYPDRTVWLLQPDAQPPRLERYQPEVPTPPPPSPVKKAPVIIMEDVK